MEPTCSNITVRIIFIGEDKLFTAKCMTLNYYMMPTKERKLRNNYLL